MTHVLSFLRSFTRPERVMRSCIGLALLIAAWACADKVVGPTPVFPKGQIGVYADVAPAGITTLVIQVSGPGIVKANGDPDTLAFNIPLTNGVAAGSLDVPAGPDRVITARAFIGIAETHRGSVTANILAGTNPTLHITMVPLVGSIPLTVSIGSTIVVVRPLLASVAVNDTIRLTSEIRDHNGTLVPSKVRWATLNPNKASVDTNGLVTVRDTGDVQIVGTYGTVGGASKISGVAVASVAANHLTWNGSINTSWAEVNNWTPHGLGAARVPTLTDSVVIPAAAPRMPTLQCVDDNAVRDIVIEQGASLGTFCFALNVYGSAVVRGSVTTVFARPNAKLAGNFADLYIKGGGVTLIDSVVASSVQVEAPTGTFLFNHHTLRTINDFNVSNGATVTMTDGDTLIIGGNSNWSGGDHTGLLTGGVVFSRGTQFHGPRYYASGKARLILDRVGTGATQLSGFDYINSPNNSLIRRLEIKSRDGATICGYIRITDTLSLTSTGTPSTLGRCSSYNVRIDGPVITAANTDVNTYLMELHHVTGTSLVAGTWHPDFTDFTVADQLINPTLAYGSLRFFAPNVLPANMAITGHLWVQGTSVELDFAGHKLQVGNHVQTEDGAILKMANAADSLIIGEYLQMSDDFHALQKPKLSAGVITIGAYLEGTGFASSGTRVVMTGTSASTSKYINSVNFESRATQEMYDLEIAANANYGLCARVRVTHEVIVRSGARLRDWCGGAILAVQNDLIGEPTSTIDPGFVHLNSTIGTSHVLGAYNAGETHFNVANAVIKPGLAYQNVRVFAPTQLTGATTLTGFLYVSGAAANLTINGQTLAIGNYLQMENSGTLTMNNPNDVVTVAEYAQFPNDNSAVHNGKLTAGTLSIGAQLEGTGFSASGTHTVVMAGTSASTSKYINSMNFESRAAQGFQNLEIATGKTYGLCTRVAVHGTLTVRDGATLQDWCSQPYLRLDGNMVGEATSTIKPYNVMLNSAFGTDNVTGTFTPAYTSIHSAAVAGHLKPGLGYQSLQFYAPVALNGDVAVNGELNVDGPAAVLTLNGHDVVVAGNLNMRSNGTLVMQNAADSLDIAGNVSWNGGGNEAGKLTHGKTVFRGTTVCATNYQTGTNHTTIFDRQSGGPVRFQCVSSSSTSQLLTHVQVKGQGLALECNMNVAQDLDVVAGATVSQSCGSGTLYVGEDLITASGSSVTNGAAYPSSQSMSVMFGSATGTQHVSGAFDPHVTYFTAIGSHIKPNGVGGVAYRHMRIDQSSSFIGTTDIAGGLEVINAAIVDLNGNTVVVRGSMDLNNSARLKMTNANDTLVVGLDDPAADLNWDAGDNSTDGVNPLLTNGAVKFYGDNFRGSQYKAALSTRHRFIFASPASGNVSLEGSPRFANLEIRTPRPIVNNSGLTVVQDSLMMGASTSYGGPNQLQILGDLVTQAASDLSVVTVYLDGAKGTIGVGGRFRPTTALFRATTPDANAIKTGLEYQNVAIQNGQYQLNGITTTAFDLDISTNGRLLVNGQTLSVGGGLNVSNTAGLVMNQSGDVVNVAGTFQVNGGQVGTVFSAGTLTLSGNVNIFDNIIATGTHKVVIAGGAAKSVSAFNGASRAFQDIEIGGSGAVNLQSGIYVNGTMRLVSPATVIGSTSSTTVNGQLITAIGTSFTAVNLNLNDASGTSLVDGTLTVTGTIMFGTGTQSIKAGAGFSYANMSIGSNATVTGSPFAVPGTLTINGGGTLAVPTGAILGTVNVNTGGAISFLGSSLSTGTLTISSGANAATADQGATVFVDFGRIQLNGGGTLDNALNRTSGQGGFRYKLAGSPSGFTNGNGGSAGITGPLPIGQ